MLVTLHDKHPLWSILRMAVIFVGAIGVLHVTASHFDIGELKAAGVVSLLSVIFDVTKRNLASSG